MRIADTTHAINSETALHPLNVHAENTVSPMDMALQELQEASGSALTETLEDMGMALGGRLRDYQQADVTERQELRQQALLKMVQRMQQQEGGISPQLMQQGLSQNIGQQILSVASLLTADGVERKKRKTLNQQLAELMAQEGWEVALFGILELGHIDKGVLTQINRLFQQAMDEEAVSLAEWFQRIVAWPDRRQRVRVLLRLMAFELSACVAGGQQQRLAAVLVRLRRLLLFLGLEKECRREEAICQLPAESLLPLLIDITNESWVFEEWMMSRLTPLVTSRSLLNRLLQQLDALFLLMPEHCFNDEEQREQVITVLRGMKGDQAIT
ncbi:type III secretion system protein SsaL [Yersinia aldovae]|uniref:Type III secretion system protein SsaL n=1 Tax=Yersinia aldovae TaxID=29483 RepID=A0A0T9U5X9_YERAL|nr:TyeA family type III secretion system gatekeeper subunit [Yersinia aldovae]CNL19643.1 type III secretion system protein SsaL [Yersinia aldovae]CNL65946.1 type III secretion system protein SsaL [Yersinia aldovae]